MKKREQHEIGTMFIKKIIVGGKSNVKLQLL